jgi:hypothetical protein
MNGFDIFVSYVAVFGLGLALGADSGEAGGAGLILLILSAVIELTRFLTLVA